MTPDEADARKRHDEAMARFDERLGAMRETLELQISLDAEAQKRQDAAIALHEQKVALHEQKVALHEQQIVLHEQQIALHEQRMSKTAEEHAKTERTLRRAIRLGVQWARDERRKRQELDKRQQDLVEYADHRHRELEALVNKFLERGGNGQH
jgi:hypothetical protein